MRVWAARARARAPEPEPPATDSAFGIVGRKVETSRALEHAAALRPIRAPRPHQRGGHGRGVSCARHRARRHDRGAEAHPPADRGGRRLHPDVRGRSARRAPARAPAHRADVRLRPSRRPLLHRVRVRERQGHARGLRARGEAAAADRASVSALRLLAHRRGALVRARAQGQGRRARLDRPPRREPAEHHGVVRWRREAHRLRHREGRGQAEPHRRRHHQGQVRLHEPGADPWARDRSAHGHLLARHLHVGAAHPEAALPSRQRAPRVGEDPELRHPPAVHPRAQRPGGARPDRDEGAGQGSERAVSPNEGSLSGFERIVPRPRQRRDP